VYPVTRPAAAKSTLYVAAPGNVAGNPQSDAIFRAYDVCGALKGQGLIGSPVHVIKERIANNSDMFAYFPFRLSTFTAYCGVLEGRVLRMFGFLDGDTFVTERHTHNAPSIDHFADILQPALSLLTENQTELIVKYLLQHASRDVGKDDPTLRKEAEAKIKVLEKDIADLEAAAVVQNHAATKLQRQLDLAKRDISAASNAQAAAEQRADTAEAALRAARLKAKRVRSRSRSSSSSTSESTSSSSSSSSESDDHKKKRTKKSSKRAHKKVRRHHGDKHRKAHHH